MNIETFFDDLEKELDCLERIQPRKLSSCTQLLINDLTAARTVQNAAQVDKIIQKARREHYHDFKSPISMPITTLVRDLRAASLDNLAKNAMDGRYDA